MNMHNELIIKSKVHDYVVGFIKQLDLPDVTLTFVDSNVLAKYQILDASEVFAVDCSEENKTLDSVAKILGIFQDRGITRNSKIAFVGGGVLQDLGTLASSIYMRGIKWIYYPTTLQAMIDSCIGGKSSINLNSTKNVIGNYYPPQEIAIWTEFLSTLNHDQIVCGLIEGLKISSASGRLEDFLGLLGEIGTFEFDSQKYGEIIELSLKLKKVFIESDEYDEGIRKMLNYGHTFGHAIESSSNFKVSHGIAVGVGILAAHILARDLDLLTEESTLTEDAVVILLKSLRLDMTKDLSQLDLDATVSLMRSDKKATASTFTFVLPTNSGLTLQTFTISNDIEERVKKALSLAFLKTS